jgi:cytochrome c5
MQRWVFFSFVLVSIVSIAAEARSGKDIYEQYCITCHQDGLLGAPRFHDKSDWAPRMSKKTIDELVGSSIKGLNAMPSQGTCSDCTEAEMKSAIEYMVSDK